jgi:hypothetical protein
VISGCGGVSQTGCARVPETIPNGRLLAADESVTVPVGSVVYVALVESETYGRSWLPKTFPWRSPTLTSSRVAKPVRLCSRSTLGTLRSRYTAFRAVAPGRVTVVADLTPIWRTVKSGPQTYRARLVVARR